MKQVNDARFACNEPGQLATDYQSHGGAVDISTTPKVQYGYANASDNTIRPTTMTYPDGRVLTYDYGPAGGVDDAADRVASLIDDDETTHLVDYSYLGRGGTAQSLNSPFGNGFVEADLPEPGIQWTLADLSGNDDPDIGDIYRAV